MERIEISGIDWMISFIGWRSRNLPSGGNQFSIVAEVTDSFCYDRFREKIAAMVHVKSFLSGRIKRKFPDWRPHWYFSKNDGAGMICRKSNSGEIFEITNKLAKGVSLQIIYFEQERKLLFTFSHSVFDGVGAEKFIFSLLKPELIDDVPVRSVPVDIPKMKESGRELQALMKTLPGKKILRLPNVGKKVKNEFERIQLLPEQYRSLVEKVEGKYGPFSLSLFIFALILCNLEKHLFSGMSTKKEYLFIPMSVDQRGLEREAGNEFFNHWSMLPLLIRRSVLAEGLDSTVPHLRSLYSAGLASRTPQLFSAASEAMKYIPRRIIDLIVSSSPAKTLGSMMFSFLNSDHCRCGEIRNLAHYPSMPIGNNLGVFVNLYDDNLNIIISRRPWKDSDSFEAFLKDISIQLQEMKV